MIRISLPYPPSIWDMYEGWGKSRHLTKSYDKWRLDAGWFIKRPAEPLGVPFVAHIALKRNSKLSDLDNRAKPVLDALQHYGVIKNDNLCERLTMQWDHGMKDECVVLVIPAEEGLAA